MDGQYARVLALTAYPRTVTAGWLAPLVESDLPIELSIHVHPLDSAAMVRALGTHVARLQAGRLASLRGEHVADPEQDIALEDAERLRSQLQQGDESAFSVGLYVLVRAMSPGASTNSPDASRPCSTACWPLASLLWQQEGGYRSCLPKGRDRILITRNWTPAPWPPPCRSSARAVDGARHAAPRLGPPRSRYRRSVRRPLQQLPPGRHGANGSGESSSSSSSCCAAC